VRWACGLATVTRLDPGINFSGGLPFGVDRSDAKGRRFTLKDR